MRLDPDEKLTLDEQDSINPNFTLKSPKMIIERPTKSYIDSLHEENEQSRRSLGLDFYEESSDLVKNIQTNDFNDNISLTVRSVQINDDPSSDNHVVNKNYVDDDFLTKKDSSIVKNNQNNGFDNNDITNVKNIEISNSPTNDNHVITKKYLKDELDTSRIVRLNDDSSDRYLQVHIQKITYNLQMHNETQKIGITKLLFPNTGYDLVLQNWKINCNNRNGEGRPLDFIKSTKPNTPTGQSGAESLPPIGNCFDYLENRGNIGDSASDDVFVLFERTDFIHISRITFYYNRFSISLSSHRNMAKLEIQLLRNGVWETEYTMDQDTNFSALPTDRTLLNMNIISQPNDGIKLV